MTPIELFKPEDFVAVTACPSFHLTPQWFVETCNAKLNEWLNSQPVYYGGQIGVIDRRMRFEQERKFDGPTSEWATHTARLVMIEPIARDTAEGLLREFVANNIGQADLLSRSRKLLGEG